MSRPGRVGVLRALATRALGADGTEGIVQELAGAVRVLLGADQVHVIEVSRSACRRRSRSR